MEKRYMEDWEPLTVGCHWRNGEYSISTQTGGGEESGYALYRRGMGQLNGRYESFERAAQAAAEHQQRMREP
jgi:hypothetical protein